uniref:DNA-directed RNA polymerases I, II, and III subunit RPABC1 n=1 Tax=Pinguiococcus pyrenoidosus TaxID=172671 RepID=A0A7R9UF39_9STRA
MDASRDNRDDLSRMYRARKTMLKMMKARGYAVDFEEGEADQTTWSLEQFLQHFGDDVSRRQLDFVSGKPDDEEDTIYVGFHEEDKKVSKSTILEYVQKMQELKVKAGVLVSVGDLSTQGRDVIRELARTDFSLDHFKEEDVLIDITEHRLVPEHIVLSTKEKKQLLDRYKLKLEQLPRILPEDPVARYLGLKRFQVVKIIRPSETAGRYVTYRVCL